MNNITIGPALEIGGNIAEMTSKGKIQVTDSKGHIKTLSQDEFKKNIIKNADKINAGEDFEFKKDHKGLKIASAAAGTAVVVAAAIYHKEIGKYIKEFSFKKAWDSVKEFSVKKVWKNMKNFAKSVKEFFINKKHVRTVYDKETANMPLTFDKDFAKTKKTLQYKREAEVARVNKFVEEFENSAKATKGLKHYNKQREYDKLAIK